MRILFITDLYPVKNNEETTPKTLLNFVKEWEKQGHKVDVIKPNFILNSFLRGKPFYKTGLYGNVLNINYWTPFRFNIIKKIRRIEAKMQSLYSPTTLHSSLFTLHYDVIIAHMPSGILYADKLGVPFVAGVHNSDLEVLTNPLYKFHFRKRLKKALDNATAIACRSFVIKDKLLKLYPEFESKTFTAPSGIDENIIHPSPFTRHPSPIKVLTCANLKKRKNVDKVIEACKGLESFELTVIGDGYERKRLEKLDKNVKFTGWLPHNKVLEKMSESDIFILPSVGETFGMVYLEAMACGCITICTKDDGIAGIIKNGENGFLTLPISSEIKKLLLNIKNMDNDSLKTLRYNSLQTIREYTSDKCAREYLQQIFKIL